MRHIVFFSIFLAISFATLAAAPDSDRAAIEEVVEQFRQAIITKDKGKFLQTFLHNQVTWQAATSVERHASELKSDPAAKKVSYSAADTPEAFINGIISSSANIEETFSDVTIDTDGTVAAVAFNFQFLRNGTAINAGREYWLLVKTDTGWKIAAVTWSRNTP